jgi:hypothetical protein
VTPELAPNGGDLLVTGLNGRLSLWDLEDGLLIGSPIPLPGRSADELSFGSTGRLYSVSGRTVIKWDLRLGSWVARACQIAKRNLTELEWNRFLPSTTPHETCPTATEP